MHHGITAQIRATIVPRLAVGIAGLALAATLTGCGPSDSTATDSTGSTTTDAASGVPGGGGGEMPGAFGTIAAADGDILQVQSDMSGQVAVTVADDTEITDQVTAALSDLEVGECVVVRSSNDSETDTGTVTAESVAISAVGDESCAAGGPGRSGEMPSDMPTDMPTDMPSDRGGIGVVGEVTAVGGSGFTVVATVPGSDSAEETAVEVTEATTYTTERAADASVLTVSRCVNATGETDDTGAMTAERISVSDPVDGECAMGGFGGSMGTRGAGS